MQPLSERHVSELDGIRGWACLSVLSAHCLTGFFTRDLSPILGAFNESTLLVLLSGVDLFFVLSGFLIGGILIDQKGQDHFLATFWIKRIARIAPVAYLLLGTYAVALAVISQFGITRFDGWLLAEPRPSLLSFASFTQSLPIAAGGYGGPRWMGITWSLAIEEQFYILFPLAVLALSRRRLVLLVAAGIVIAPVLRDLFERLYGQWYAPYVLMPSRMDALFYGVGVTLILRNETARRIAVQLRIPLNAIALLFLALFLSGYSFALWPPVHPGSPFPPLKQSAMAIMWAIVLLNVFTAPDSIINRVWRMRFLKRIRAISYALYMYHQAVNGLVHGLLFGSEPAIGGWAQFFAVLGVMAIAIALATLSWRYFETPIRRFGRRVAHNLSGQQSRATGDDAAISLKI